MSAIRPGAQLVTRTITESVDETLALYLSSRRRTVNKISRAGRSKEKPVARRTTWKTASTIAR